MKVFGYLPRLLVQFTFYSYRVQTFNCRSDGIFRQHLCKLTLRSSRREKIQFVGLFRIPQKFPAGNLEDVFGFNPRALGEIRETVPAR